MTVGIIGAGIAGLATAIRLANKGYKVCVFEKNALAGGKLSEIKKEGYRFDTGPSLFTLPHLFDDLFAESKENMADFLQYKGIDNNCHYFFADGTEFNFYHDRTRLKKEIETKTKEDFKHIEKRLNQSAELYDLSAPVFIFSAFQNWSNYNRPEYKKMLFKLHKLNFFQSMHQANRSAFTDPNLVQLFDRYASYNGSSPYKAPATLNMIAHLENNIGSFFPEKGMYQLVECLYQLALKKGVEFRFNSLVEKIEIAQKEAKAIWVNKQSIPFDLIISDSDAKYAANQLFDNPLRRRLNRLAPSSSALIFYWGMKNLQSPLDLHNILFSANYKKENRAIFKTKTLYEDPTIYIFISSKFIPTDAPPNSENWFVMINVPSDSGQDWDQIVDRARIQIINKIEKTLGISVKQHLEVEEIATPLSIEQKTLSRKGALYGSASNSMFSAFLRHPNQIKSIKNLYFVGGSVHPGGGIPLCMASSMIVDNEIPPAL